MLVRLSAKEELAKTFETNDEGYGRFAQSRSCLARYAGISNESLN